MNISSILNRQCNSRHSLFFSVIFLSMSSMASEPASIIVNPDKYLMQLHLKYSNQISVMQQPLALSWGDLSRPNGTGSGQANAPTWENGTEIRPDSANESRPSWITKPKTRKENASDSKPKNTPATNEEKRTQLEGVNGLPEWNQSN